MSRGWTESGRVDVNHSVSIQSEIEIGLLAVNFQMGSAPQTGSAGVADASMPAAGERRVRRTAIDTMTTIGVVVINARDGP